MPDQLRCETCGISFQTKEAMMEHGAKHHDMGRGQEHLKCNACGTEFHSESELQQHSKASHAM